MFAINNTWQHQAELVGMRSQTEFGNEVKEVSPAPYVLYAIRSESLDIATLCLTWTLLFVHPNNRKTEHNIVNKHFFICYPFFYITHWIRGGGTPSHFIQMLYIKISIAVFFPRLVFCNQGSMEHFPDKREQWCLEQFRGIVIVESLRHSRRFADLSDPNSDNIWTP